MDKATALLTASGAVVTGILGGWALVVRARGESAKPSQLLRRLWDWIEAKGHASDVPPTLAEEIRQHILEDE